MKRLIPRALVLAVGLALSCIGCAQKPQLSIFTWDEMIPPEIIAAFEKESGLRVNYINFDTNEAMLLRLQSVRGRGYDLVIADDYIIETVIAEGLAQKLDKSKIANFRNINRKYQGQFYDPLDEYTVPYGAGVQTIVYDPGRVSREIRGYGDLWHPSLAGEVGIIENFRVINGMALKVMGESYNTNDVSKIRDAGELLRSLAPNIRLIRDDYLYDGLLTGEISAAVMYTSEATAAKMARPELEMVFPVEGIGFGIMAAFIPVNAPNPDAAHAFLDYILDAENGARCFEYLGYYSTNEASDACIDPEYRDFLTLPEGYHIDMEMIGNVSPEAEEMHSLVWTVFKAAAGR